MCIGFLQKSRLIPKCQICGKNGSSESGTDLRKWKLKENAFLCFFWQSKAQSLYSHKDKIEIWCTVYPIHSCICEQINEKREKRPVTRFAARRNFFRQNNGLSLECKKKKRRGQIQHTSVTVSIKILKIQRRSTIKFKYWRLIYRNFKLSVSHSAFYHFIFIFFFVFIGIVFKYPTSYS